jgi:SdpC family antimicrobial peptide
MMKNIRKFSSNPACIILLCSVFLLFSCKDSYVRTNVSEFTGKQLFEGIYFGSGSVPLKLASLNKITKIDDLISPTDAKYNEVIAIRDLLISSIEKNDVNFFSFFKNGIQSGDRFVIENAITQGALKCSEAIQELSGLNGKELSAAATDLIAKYKLKNEKGEISPEKIKLALKSLSNGRVDAANREQCVLFALILLVAVAISAVLFLVNVAIFIAYIVRAEERVGTNSLFFDELVEDVVVNLHK